MNRSEKLKKVRDLLTGNAFDGCPFKRPILQKKNGKYFIFGTDIPFTENPGKHFVILVENGRGDK